jgi:hypothetical protein
MCRFLHKPLGTPIRDFIARLVEMNNYLPQFPPQQLGGAVGVILDDEELKEVSEFSFPASWQKGMVHIRGLGFLSFTCKLSFLQQGQLRTLSHHSSTPWRDHCRTEYQ